MKQSIKPVLGVIAAGLVLGATILLWNKDGAGKHAPGEKAAHAAHGERPGGAEHGREDAGQVAMTAEQIRGAGIVLAKAGPAGIGAVLQFPGEVKFNEDRTAHVVPRLPGVAESVQADLGQQVKKGQVLALISSPELAELRSTQLAAQKRLALAQLTYEREKKLWQDKISAEQDYLQARQVFHEAQIQVQSASAKLDALGAGTTGGGSQGALNRYVLRAPFDGVVVEKHIALGEAVKEDANVFLLSDLSTVWVEVNVAARDIEAVRTGEPVTVQSTSTPSTATGKISHVGSLLGEQTRSAKARVVIANPRMAWRPGLFVNVTMAQGVRRAPVAVQSDAVRTVDGKAVVFTRTAQGFLANPVRTGVTDGAMVEILEGLSAGASYAAAGSFVVKAQQAKGGAGHEH